MMPRKKPNQKSKLTPQQYITNWIIERVEKVYPEFGDMPMCPYARQARLEGKIKMIEIRSNEDDGNCWTHIDNCDFDKNEVLILIADQKRWTWRQLYKMRVDMNRIFNAKNITVLEDHPGYRERVAGVTVTNGRYALLFAQRRDKLNRFAKILKKTSRYYDQWSEKAIADVVTWREDPE
jgi:hypothetical protein